MEELVNKKSCRAHVRGNAINLDGALYEIPIYVVIIIRK